LIWQVNVTKFLAIPSPDVMIRATPALYQNLVIVGTHMNASLLALDQSTGFLQWNVSLDSHWSATISSAITIYQDDAYVGIASVEENLLDFSYPCCTFRGSLVKIHLPTQTIIWKWYTIPENNGNSSLYAGVSIWGSAPAIDIKRNQIYVATGNNYHVPASVAQCQAIQNNKTIPDYPNPCIEKDNHVDAVVALDLDQGNVKWSQNLFGYDTSMLACYYRPNSVCQEPEGPDYDYATAPMFVTTPVGDFVVAGQKTGVVWGFDPDTGNITWSQIIGPDGSSGGILYGLASDKTRIYGASANSNNSSHTLMNNMTITYGSWSATNASTGKLIWQTPDPRKGGDAGGLTIADGVLYGGSTSGHFYALNSETGSILFDYATPSQVMGGPSIVEGDLYCGSGSTWDKRPTIFYAFTINQSHGSVSKPIYSV